MKKALTILRKSFLVVTGGLAVYLSMAVFLSALYVPAKTEDCADKTTIYLRHSPVHVDIVLPKSSLSDSTIGLLDLPGMARADFVIFGLGDRDIFLNTPRWNDLNPAYALKAIFLPSARAMHMETSKYVYTNWIPVEVCDSQLSDIEAYLLDGFKLDEAGNVMDIEGFSYTGQDRFYEAKGSYHMFNTCNNWANGALKAGGLKAPIWSPFSQGIIYHGVRQ